MEGFLSRFLVVNGAPCDTPDGGFSTCVRQSLAARPDTAGPGGLAVDFFLSRAGQALRPAQAPGRRCYQAAGIQAGARTRSWRACPDVGSGQA